MQNKLSLVRFIFKNYKVKYDGKYSDNLYSYILTDTTGKEQHTHFTKAEHEEAVRIAEEQLLEKEEQLKKYLEEKEKEKKTTILELFKAFRKKGHAQKQYCRYCNNLENFCDSNYCYVKDRHLAFNTIKSTNKCKYFSYNPIDATNPEREYKPRTKKE